MKKHVQPPTNVLREWRQSTLTPHIEVSNDGWCRYSDSGNIIPLQLNKKNHYHYVFIQREYRNGKQIVEGYAVHRLVAYAFLGNPPHERCDQVNHKNYDRTDNRIENIEWCTNAYNSLHGRAHRKSLRLTLTPEQVGEPKSKPTPRFRTLTPEQVREIRRLRAENQTWGARTIAKLLGLTVAACSGVIYMNRWYWLPQEPDSTTDYLYLEHTS